MAGSGWCGGAAAVPECGLQAAAARSAVGLAAVALEAKLRAAGSMLAAASTQPPARPGYKRQLEGQPRKPRPDACRRLHQAPLDACHQHCMEMRDEAEAMVQLGGGVVADAGAKGD